MATTDGSQVSLRPMSLRPGGGGSKNPFERFARGAGFAVKAKAVDVLPYEEEKKKPRSEVRIYEREQLEAFQEVNIRCPPELANFPELQINTIEAPRVAQVDDRDWRGRAEGAPPSQEGWKSREPAAAAAAAPGADQKGRGPAGDKPAPAAAQPRAQQPAQPAQPVNPNTMRMQKAEELGRAAWQRGATQEGNKRTLKEVKGILNKLTPEKFDRLSAQLLQLVTNSEVLQGTITLIFENAVAQPTFVKLYANLCDALATALPDSLTGSDRNQSFKRILLNTCQEEFEGATDARLKAAGVPAEERPEAERRAKLRMLGNIRLIAELFNSGIVAEKIVVVCIEELLGGPKDDPVEDNVEALCELMTNAGKKLEATTRNRAKFEGFFTSLDRLSKQKKLPPRIRFLIRDTLDLRRSQWIPRRDVLQAKKIDEIHKEAHAELGMVPPPTLPVLQALPALPPIGPAGAAQQIELFPAFRGGDAGWEASGRLKGTMTVGGKQQSSAFFLEEDPMAAPSAAPAAAAAAASEAAPEAKPARRAPLKGLSAEERESRSKSLFSEYVSSRDYAEATACVQELEAPGFLPQLVSVGVERMLDAMDAGSQQALAELLVRLAKDGSVPAADLREGLRKHVDGLEDLRIDVPVAPKALGHLLGEAAAQGVLPLAELPELVAKVEETESRRLLVAALLKTLKEKVGEEAATKQAADAKLDAQKLFAADPEFDPEDLPSVADFLKAEGLQAVLPV